MDDACQRGVGGGAGHAKLEFTGLVDGAGIDRVSDAAVDGQALARHRRLIYRAASFGDDAIERHALTGTNAHDGVERYAGRWHGLPAAVCLLHVGFFRRKRDQALDRVAGTVGGTRFDQFGDGVERHDHRGFRPLADDESAGHGHAHQRIDVQTAVAQRLDSLGIGLDARQPDRDCGHAEAHVLHCRDIAGDEVQRLGADGQCERGAQANHTRRLLAMSVAVAVIVIVVMPRMVVAMVAVLGCVGRSMACAASRRAHRHRLVTGALNSFDRQRNHVGRCVDRHRSRAQLEVEALDAGNLVERTADVAFFHRTVHCGDAEDLCAQGNGCLGCDGGPVCTGHEGHTAVVVGAGAGERHLV